MTATNTTAAKTTASHKTYAVRSGDTLTSISQKFFGDKNHTDEIYKANRKLIGSNPNALKVGMKLEIPAK
jgi:nucleoid-associated protein YgaU